VAGLADLWTEVAGQDFRKNIDAVQNAEFAAEASHVISELVSAIEPTATFAQIRTALKKVPVARSKQNTGTDKG
jgi:hypothetical protein